MGLDDIYTELIAEESRNSEHKHHLSAPTVTLKGRNPSCGDEITIELEIAGGMVKDASFTGVGCAISQASASMMIGLIKGKSVEEAKRLAGLFMGMIKGDVTDEEQLEELGDAAALESVSHLPARVKCAVLGWHTLDEALEEK